MKSEEVEKLKAWIVNTGLLGLKNDFFFIGIERPQALRGAVCLSEWVGSRSDMRTNPDMQTHMQKPLLQGCSRGLAVQDC